jgi:SAM-dependent methyltransferase
MTDAPAGPSDDELEAARLARQLGVVRRGREALRAELGAELDAWLREHEHVEARDLARELRRTSAQLEALRASPAYRLGDALLEPARALRDVGRRLRARLRPAPLGPARPVRAESKYERAGAYHWTYHEDHDWYRTRLEAVADWARPGDAALDLGCGDGVAAWVVGRRCRRVVGLDLDPAAIAAGREELRRRGAAHVELRLGRVEGSAAALRGERFDLVYSLDCIEHLDDPAALLDAMRAACRPGGVVIVGTPLYLCEPAVSPYHARELTLRQLEGLCAPRFRTIGHTLLPAPRPDVKGRLDPRYCLWVGRRRRLG